MKVLHDEAAYKLMQGWFRDLTVLGLHAEDGDTNQVVALVNKIQREMGRITIDIDAITPVLMIKED